MFWLLIKVSHQLHNNIKTEEILGFISYKDFIIITDAESFVWEDVIKTSTRKQFNVCFTLMSP